MGRDQIKEMLNRAELVAADLRCSKGQENVSFGMDWSQLRRLRSESLKSDWLSTLVNLMPDVPFEPVAFC